MNKCVIVGGVKINNTAQIKEYIDESDFVIACDSGITSCKELGITPNLIVGDFDSHEKPDTEIETITLPTAKDDTDTMFAAKEAVNRGFGEVVLLGAVGDRIDHTLANVYILSYLQNEGVKGLIVDDFSEMLIIGKNGQNTGKISDIYGYFSLICLEGKVEGVTIKNAKFPLENGIITPNHQYATSNEVLPGEVAEVSIEKGSTLLVKVFK